MCLVVCEPATPRQLAWPGPRFPGAFYIKQSRHPAPGTRGARPLPLPAWPTLQSGQGGRGRPLSLLPRLLKSFPGRGRWAGWGPSSQHTSGASQPRTEGLHAARPGSRHLACPPLAALPAHAWPPCQLAPLLFPKVIQVVRRNSAARLPSAQPVSRGWCLPACEARSSLQPGRGLKTSLVFSTDVRGGQPNRPECFGWPPTVCDALNGHSNTHVKTWISVLTGRIRPSVVGQGPPPHRDSSSPVGGRPLLALSPLQPTHPGIFSCLSVPDIHSFCGRQASLGLLDEWSAGCSEKTREQRRAPTPGCPQRASSRRHPPRPLSTAPLTLLCLQQPDSGSRVCAETGPQGLCCSVSPRPPPRCPAEWSRQGI